ncbi:6-bladed beta-propeller [Bacteroides cellulosilyticus]|uniref:6-bladed beta-propeller n=1 Tax=Bacteroides cellulosilyticus TaxID=246787 RepID=UPI001C37DF1F|nr:6-bladed beta-propeller [Bacteroides cellulosilyticus]MBV3638732.1 6-bladed beta-propeller [Bacteroides cellulosilyticus]MBV3664980.1 6-bladed beta-propeller [Bacteroides cellulosilyticus]MBV3686910.1 6-bladed beta-propeller [Bacteroides cellulosilyticus]MBV3695702.1 6-bladed beta-propeller [Bacteroides cellulosilyticus]MBV3709271.1 6-bladed beta-propeller [Bacteroides cellulosilyticus]
MMGVKCAAVNKILFCILLFVLFSCKNENHKVDRGEIFIANLDSTCTSEFKYSDLYKKVTAIILDNKEVMLTEISKMLVYKDKLYLLDRRAQGVYAFCKDGSFVCKFGNLGAGPDEYVSCNDFGINADAGEIYIYDMAKHRIHKYDIFSASYKESIIIDKSIDIDYIMCNSGCLYAAQASNRNEEKESIYYLLYQIDVKSGKKIAQWFDAVYYNKGWNDELIHGNIFYNIRENKDLFVLGLMDTIMCIKGDAVFPFLAIESERLVQKEDFLKDEKVPTSNPRVRGKRMMSLLTRLSAQNKIYQISDVFECDSMLYFSCMGRILYFVQYNEKKRIAFTYSRVANDVLFRMIPEYFQLPKFLCADSMGGYYYISNDNLAELKYFIDEDNISEKLINRESIKELNEDSNPVILYYEYKN